MSTIAEQCRRRVISTLSIWTERQRVACKLRFYDGLTQEQVGERMGVSQQMAERIIATACAAFEARSQGAVEIVIEYGE